MNREKAIEVVLSLVREELMRALAKHSKPFNSAHEGYAVIAEELDELWQDVKSDKREHACDEAIQVAAMGVRFVLDCNPSFRQAIGGG